MSYVLCCVLALWVAVVSGYAAVPADFRWLAPVLGDLPPDTPVRLPLPRQVLAEAQPGLADIRLFDDQGLETPYVIYPQSAPTSTTVVLPVLSYSQEQDGDSIVLQRPPQAGPLSALTVQTSARDFHKTVRLQSSQDQVTWREVTTGAIFDFSSRIDVRRTTLTFPATEAPYLRLLLTDAAPPRSDAAGLELRYNGLELLVRGETTRPFRIEQISGRVGPPQTSDDIYDRATLSQPETHTPAPGQTLVGLGRLNLPVVHFTLTAENPYYHRRVEVWGADVDQDDAYHQVASGVVYKLPGVVPAETTLRVAALTSPYVRLKILNGDNPPLRLQAVDIAWARHDLYFIPAAGRRYTLYVGGRLSAAPSYELRHLLPASHALRERHTVVGLGALQPHSQYQPASTPPGQGQMAKLGLTALVLLLVVGLGWWAYRLLKVLAKPGG